MVALVLVRASHTKRMANATRFGHFVEVGTRLVHRLAPIHLPVVLLVASWSELCRLDLWHTATQLQNRATGWGWRHTLGLGAVVCGLLSSPSLTFANANIVPFKTPRILLQSTPVCVTAMYRKQ